MSRALCIDCIQLQSLLLLLFQTTGLQYLVQFNLPLRELLLDFSMAADGLLDPGMSSNLLNLGSFQRIECDYLHKEILEGLAEEPNRPFSGMRLPKDIVLLLLDQLVVGIGRSSLLEGRIASQHDEQYDSSRENIAALSLILLRGDFRSHIPFGA